MRTLVLMRGAPGCGKSTWIREHGLTDYALSADAIRSLYASPELSVDGRLQISQRNDKVVWQTLFDMLERRMQRGDFTIIDACNSKTSEMNRYKALADQYRYRIYCIDMTGIPIDEVLRRNNARPELKVVPAVYIQRVYSRFETQKIPSGVKRILPEEFDTIFVQPIDLSAYKRVVHIGDIHGCYDALQKVFGEEPVRGIDPDTAYIFLGDYGDRGPDTPKVLNFLFEISQFPNVCLLEGNHEAHLWAWANDKQSVSREFERRTRFELETAGVDKANIRRLYRKLRQCSWYTWRGHNVLCTHGGIPGFGQLTHIDYVPAIQMIKGVGAYEEVTSVAEAFDRQGAIGTQVFGHRNIGTIDAMAFPRSILLENAVERGGTLRVATLDESGFSISEYQSESAIAMQARFNEGEAVPSPNADIIEALVAKMRSSKLINEKRFGRISSFNFSRTAFADRKWNDLTVRARGLYIDTSNMKIVARGYEKFFAVEERNETSRWALSRNLAFPVEVFKKENGFLGLLSYDHATQSLFVTTKSSPDGDMAHLFDSMLSDVLRHHATALLKERDVTLLFEVIHPEADPHIIEYTSPKLFLLDCVPNTLDFSAAPYEELVEIAKVLGVDVKQRTAILQNWSEFDELYKATQSPFKPGETPFEGYVIRDANGFMVKMKTNYYTTWKMLRGVADTVCKQGYIRRTEALSTPLKNYFYAFARDWYAAHPDHMDIISLRKRFAQSPFASELKEAI